jgi:crotonobetainyl-CoA:carnitine CoA-transferase CaiB-like acyl-CoA transferase
MAAVFADPHVRARGMAVTMPYPHSQSGTVSVLGSPLNLSATPVTYRLPPPLLGEHTSSVLEALPRPGTAGHGPAAADQDTPPQEVNDDRRSTG